jgi:hypothetical protein
MLEAEVVHRTSRRAYVVGIARTHEDDNETFELFHVEHSKDIVGCSSQHSEKKRPDRLWPGRSCENQRKRVQC